MSQSPRPCPPGGAAAPVGGVAPAVLPPRAEVIAVPSREELAARPLSEHVAVLEDLQARLGALLDATG